MQMRYLWLFLLVCGISFKGVAQRRPINTEAEIAGAVVNGPQTPFWLRSNQYGIIPLEGSFVTARAGAFRHYIVADSSRPSPKKLDWGVGVQSVLNVVFSTKQKEILWPEIYAKGKWGKFEIFAGRRRELFGIGDSTLSSGFVAWSGNAIPFPKIQLQTIDYVPLTFLKSIIAFKGSFAHGWFTVPYMENAFFHQKTLYARFGKPHWRLQIYAGLNHQVQWGGKADYLLGTDFAVNGQLPSTFRDYLSVLTGHYPDDLSNDRYTVFDGTNRIGNHVGSYDFGIEWKHSDWNVLLYHQHPYEDASGLAFQNFPDGLTGLRLLRRGSAQKIPLRHLVIEWLSTTNQSGAIFDPQATYQGTDNYFNHGQYKEGWSYQEHTLGTPFIAPRPTLAAALAQIPAGGFFPNNQVRMVYLATAWQLSSALSLQTRSSFSQNLGSFSNLYTPAISQFSNMIGANWQLPHLQGFALHASFAFDQGDLLPPSYAGFFGLKKKW